MKVVAVLLLLCFVKMTIASVLNPRGGTEQCNEGHRECKGGNKTPGSLKHVSENRTMEEGRWFTKSLSHNFFLPLLFYFKLQATATAILFVLLAIKKILIIAALLFPKFNNPKSNGHYIMNLKVPREHEDGHHMGVQRYSEGQVLRGQPYGVQGNYLERRPAQPGSSQTVVQHYATGQVLRGQPYGAQTNQATTSINHQYKPYSAQVNQPTISQYQPYAFLTKQATTSQYKPYNPLANQPTISQYYVIPHPSGPQVYSSKINSTILGTNSNIGI